ncbi:response regulator [Clostridium sp. MCC353]|uniref:response regulator n=1 Tax=Clostridium sp. MCC353 TaxID=2592646 RepID=UPI001C03A07E|nr:response regulator [Clostridium sp. MCC353]MBT9778898.1 response regulator [Clostridium sp. MCC353]
MKTKQKQNAFLLVLSLAVILVGGICYITGVQRSLWNEAVTDILEVTAQGGHALDIYIEKDMEMLHQMTAQIAADESNDEPALLSKMQLSDDLRSSYICVNLDTGRLYTSSIDDPIELEPEQLNIFRSFQGRGIREPFLDGHTGIWTMGYYERFWWPDGSEGYAQKAQPLSEIAERFSLSFYNNTGFSYVVNRDGDILIRSRHRSSNRTFHNLFDIIDLQGNDPLEVKSFQGALSGGQKGVARFRYQGEEYVFCYVPMESSPDWYVVSIVPNRIIMEQADNIIHNSQVFLLIILACSLVTAAFFILYRNSASRILLAEEDARKAAESANLAKSRFLSNMSHDIRTPMNAIIGMTRLAFDHAEEPEKVREYLKNISQSGQLLIGLINDILDMSKIESGKMTLNNDTASLKTLLSGLVNIVQPTIAKKNQTFDIRLHHIEHETLYFDSLRLNQVMINLLSNAVKFTPEGGSVCVDVTESPSARENCAHFTFRVSDNGIGMKPEFLENIFDSFTREQDSRVTQTEGSGLGMAITKMIVDIMGGMISVESEQGKGSVFTVELDLALPGSIPDEDMLLPRIRVLFVDDDSDTCRAAGEFLRQLGVEFDIAEHGQTSVEKAVSAHFQGQDYDLILMDWKMPDLNGIQAAEMIRSQTGHDIPIIIISAYDWSTIETQALESGINGFIQKPIFKSSLYYCILKHVMHAETADEKNSDVIDLSGLRILLAEDNMLNQEIVRELLTGMGARIDTADNGLSCAEKFEQSPPGYYDLILMDVQMPILNGYEAVKRIRSMDREDASTIPVFAMTADAFAEDIETAKKAGMNCHLAKPLDIPVMIRELRKYLDL